MMRVIYVILVCFAAPVAAFIAALRNLRDPSRGERLADRFGRPQLTRQSPTLWVHAASMGEVQAGAVLVRRLLAQFPRHAIVMTTMTTTGATRVKALFPERVTHCYLPYDLPAAVRGFLDRAHPEAALILETELWPNVLLECGRRRIPVLIASARISPRTAARYRRLKSLFRDALRNVVVAAQTDADAKRFEALGANNVQVIGNIKFDIDIPDAVKETGAELRKYLGDRFVWAAGSTHAGEETILLAAHRKLVRDRKDALLIVAPRHPERFEEVRALLVSSGMSFVARSSAAAVGPDICVLLIDTMGELLACYAAADVAFVGGSLVPAGVHNLLEPAALGVPVLSGPHVQNAQESADRLAQAGGAYRVSSTELLTREIIRLAADPVARSIAGHHARQVVIDNRGVAARTLELLAAIAAGR